MSNYDMLHKVALKFCNHFRPFSKMVGGISVVMRDDLIEMYCLENDSCDMIGLTMLINEMLRNN